MIRTSTKLSFRSPTDGHTILGGVEQRFLVKDPIVWLSNLGWSQPKINGIQQDAPTETTSCASFLRVLLSQRTLALKVVVGRKLLCSAVQCRSVLLTACHEFLIILTKKESVHFPAVWRNGFLHLDVNSWCWDFCIVERISNKKNYYYGLKLQIHKSSFYLGPQDLGSFESKIYSVVKLEKSWDALQRDCKEQGGNRKNKADCHKSRARNSISHRVGQSVSRSHFPTFNLHKNAKKAKWDRRTDGRTDRWTRPTQWLIESRARD